MLYKSQLWTSLNESIKQIPALQSKLALSRKLQNCFRITVWGFVLFVVSGLGRVSLVWMRRLTMYSWPWWCDNVWVWVVIVRSKVNIRFYSIQRTRCCSIWTLLDQTDSVKGRQIDPRPGPPPPILLSNLSPLTLHPEVGRRSWLGMGGCTLFCCYHWPPPLSGKLYA